MILIEQFQYFFVVLLSKCLQFQRSSKRGMTVIEKLLVIHNILSKGECHEEGWRNIKQYYDFAQHKTFILTKI